MPKPEDYSVEEVAYINGLTPRAVLFMLVSHHWQYRQKSHNSVGLWQDPITGAEKTLRRACETQLARLKITQEDIKHCALYLLGVKPTRGR